MIVFEDRKTGGRFICPDDFPNQNKRKLPDERSNAFARQLISKLLISRLRYDTIEEKLGMIIASDREIM
jgi:hypothetical protein